MKQAHYNILILILVLFWPTAGVVSAPSRFSAPANLQDKRTGDEGVTSIARETGEANTNAMARLSPPTSDTRSTASTATGKQKGEAGSQVTPLAEQDAEHEAGKGEGAGETNKRPVATISRALSRRENGQASTRHTEQGQEEMVEWVGKDRRIKRVKKAPTTLYLQSHKPSGKLIITDEYHQSIPEMLGTADIRHYGARPEESKWLYSGSKFLCELRHPIPGFGFAVMKQGVDDPLQFVVETNGLIGGAGQAHIQSRPPQWKRFTLVKDLGVVSIEPKDNVLFAVSSEWVKRLSLELREGMQPTISFWDDDTGGDDVVLTISSFNFQKHLPEFAKCLGNLLPYSFKDVRKRTVYFGYDKYQLNPAQRERLKKLIEYVKLDETVKKVDITGFADSVGFARYNRILAQRRANEVKKYLLAQGLPATKLAVRAKGEKGKKHSNRTAAGRSRNRRVEVTLIK